MTERRAKTVAESRTEQAQIVMSAHINGAKRLFGGRLMEWIDVVAGVVARRHSGANVTTAAVDNLKFLVAARMDNTVVLLGRLTWVGRTSMEVRVDTFVEELTGERTLVNTAYLVMVALDGEGNPVKVPPLALSNEEERREYEAAARRNELRRQRRQEAY